MATPRRCTRRRSPLHREMRRSSTIWRCRCCWLATHATQNRWWRRCGRSRTSRRASAPGWASFLPPMATLTARGKWPDRRRPRRSCSRLPTPRWRCTEPMQNTRQSRLESARWGKAMARLALAAPLSFAVAACSSLPQGDEAPRMPSLRVANAALASGAPDMALRVADMNLAEHPNDVAALIAKGDALYAMGQTEAASTAFRSAIALDPGAVAAQLGLGRTLVESDPAGAESAFLAAMRTDATNVIVLNNLGVARDLEGRSTEAQEAYHLALELSPNSSDVKINLGRSLAAAGHNADAVAVLRQVAADPQAVQQWHNQLAAALTLAGDGSWAQKVLGESPDQPATPAESGPSVSTLDTAPPNIASENPHPVAGPRYPLAASRAS